MSRVLPAAISGWPAAGNSACSVPGIAVSAHKPGCLSVLHPAIRLCCSRVQEDTATKEPVPLDRAQIVKVFWNQVPQNQHTHLLALSLTCLRQRAANSSAIAGKHLSMLLAQWVSMHGPVSRETLRPVCLSLCTIRHAWQAFSPTRSATACVAVMLHVTNTCLSLQRENAHAFVCA